MSSLDPRFVLAFTFEKYFVDKDTGAPLSAGYIKFFQDEQRTVPKNVYKLAGTPGNYTYTSLGAVVNLNAVGVPEDNSNNNIAIYFFPYDGDPDDTTNTLELYFYQVFSFGNIEQFTREGQPNVFPGSTTETLNNNYVPNGQFLWHNDVPADLNNDYTEGKITQNSTILAPGGWSFDRTTGVNVVDIVTWDRISSPNSSNPEDSPRYRVRLNTQDSVGGGAYKDLRLKFDSVNKFQSFATPLQPYTYTFSVKNNDNTTINAVQLVLRKNYGSGGSADTERTLGTFVITPTATQIAISFDFGDNSGKTLGTHDDDYLQLAIRLDATEEFDVLFTDFGLFEEDLASNFVFAPTTDNQFTYQGLAGSITVPDYSTTSSVDTTLKQQNANLFLQPVLKLTGFDFDRSIIGRKEEIIYYDPTEWDADSVSTYTNLIIPVGQQLETANYSPLSIPYSRIQEKFWNSTLNLPVYGTGPKFMTATIPAADDTLLVSNNSEGAVTNATDGTPATGFTFLTIHKETATYYMEGYAARTSANSFADDQFYIQNKNYGAVSFAITAGTSGFTVAPIQTGTAILVEISSVITVAASALADPGNPGKYFTVDSISNVPADLSWYIWYQITNETDPAVVGRVGIKINLLATDTAITVAQKTWQAINGWQETTIKCLPASTPIPAGAYFSIFAQPSQNYVVWYEINNTGTQPVVPGAIYIKVILEGTETAVQVAAATQKAMNLKYFAMPDFTGWFFRSFNNGALNDPDAKTRNSFVPGVTGDMIGTFELSTNEAHVHYSSSATNFLVEGGTDADLTPGGGAGQFAATTSFQGGFESRPINKNVLVAIRY